MLVGCYAGRDGFGSSPVRAYRRASVLWCNDFMVQGGIASDQEIASRGYGVTMLNQKCWFRLAR
jgi:hypothetical protein